MTKSAVANASARRWAPVLCLALLAMAGPTRAARADRDKPVNLEADRITVDDLQKVQVFEDNVQLVAGRDYSQLCSFTASP